MLKYKIRISLGHKQKATKYQQKDVAKATALQISRSRKQPEATGSVYYSEVAKSLHMWRGTMVWLGSLCENSWWFLPDITAYVNLYNFIIGKKSRENCTETLVKLHTALDTGPVIAPNHSGAGVFSHGGLVLD